MQDQGLGDSPKGEVNLLAAMLSRFTKYTSLVVVTVLYKEVHV